MQAGVSRRMFLAAMAAASRLAAQSWKKKRFPDWSREDLNKLLTDSPWAKSEFRKFTLRDRGQAKGGTGARINAGVPVPVSMDDIDAEMEASVNVRWSSSLPIRQATALHKFGRDGLDSPEALEALAPNETYYVVDVAGLPAAVANWGVEYVRIDFYETASLTTSGGRLLKPANIKVDVGGSRVSVTLEFSREDAITPADKEVLFQAAINTLKIRRRFPLKAMVYEGRLEL